MRKAPAARRIQALWAMQGGRNDNIWIMDFPELAKDPDPAIRRALARMDRDANHYTTLENAAELARLADDPDPEVRAAVIVAVGNRLYEGGTQDDSSILKGVARLLAMVKAPLNEPTARSSHDGKKTIKVGAAYVREFERYLIRQNLEEVPRLVKLHLDSAEGESLPVEARLLATLALEPKDSAARLAQLLPHLQRPPGQEEVLRLAQFPDERGVGDALKSVLQAPATRTAALESLLAIRTKIDAAKLTPFLADAATELLAREDAASTDLGMKLTAAFKLPAAEPKLLSLAEGGLPGALPALRALAEIASARSDFFAKLVETSPENSIRDEALAALLASRAADVPPRVLALYPKLTAGQRRTALGKLTAKKPGAAAIVAALHAGTLPKSDIDAATLDRLQAVLGPDDPTLAALVESLGALFRPVLMLDGTEHAVSPTGLQLEGPFTVETWVRLDPAAAGRQTIGNADAILGAENQIDMNFYDAKLRVFFGELRDVIISKKPMTPGLWTHVAVTRNAAGIFRIYQDGEPAADPSKPAPGKLEKVWIAASGATGGTSGAMAEFRLWDRERTADEIRATFDRSLPANSAPGLIFSTTPPGNWGSPNAGAKLVKTSDFPPVATADEAAALDAKYAKFRALAEKPGDPARGKAATALCQACHLIGATGGNIGPNLSGVGAMGTEAILRNLLQPNAAMENAYRIYRVEMKDGSMREGFQVSEDKEAVVLRTPSAEDQRIPRAQIREAKFLRRSLMPEGLLEGMTPDGVSDLFAYLKTLK